MRNFFIFTLLLFSSLIAYSQVDAFVDFESLVGQKVCFYDAQTHHRKIGKFIYTQNDKNKLVAVKDITAFQSLSNGVVIDASEIISIKNKQYLVLNYKQEKLLFLISEKYDILPFFRSASYWYNILEQFKKRYNYKIINRDFYINDVKSINYKKIKWEKVIMPQSMSEDVVFVYEIDGNHVYSTYSSINEYDFETEFEVQKERERVNRIITERIEQERKDSIADCNIFLAKRLSYLNSNEYSTQKDSVGFFDEFVFKVIGDTYTSWCFGEISEGNVNGLKFVDREQLDFLKKRGSKGEITRKQFAFTADSLRRIKIKHHIDSLRRYVERLRKQTFQTIKSKQLFIFKELYSYSDYQFGKKFKFYNCFNKRIKYIDINLVAYNGVGDVQTDDWGRSSAKVRGIGPIEVDEFAIYDWDELFWDDNDIIKKVIPTQITITFMDGSIKTFSGERNINKHRTGNCYEEDDE